MWVEAAGGVQGGGRAAYVCPNFPNKLFSCSFFEVFASLQFLERRAAFASDRVQTPNGILWGRSLLDPHPIPPGPSS